MSDVLDIYFQVQVLWFEKQLLQNSDDTAIDGSEYLAKYCGLFCWPSPSATRLYWRFCCSGMKAPNETHHDFIALRGDDVFELF